MIKQMLRRIKARGRQLYAQLQSVKQPVAGLKDTVADLLFSIDSLSYGKLDGNIVVRGWAYHPKLEVVLVELDGEIIEKIKPDLARPDVMQAVGCFPRNVRPGFELVIHVKEDWFHNRGASRLAVFSVINGVRRKLAQTYIFNKDRYEKAYISEVQEENFYFTVGSSNISLGGFGDFKEKLGPFAIGTCQLGFMVPLLYMRSTKGEADDWKFDPGFSESLRQRNGKPVIGDSLNSIIEFSRTKQLPCVIGLNGGIWGDASGTCPEWDLTDHLEENKLNCQWNQYDEVMPDDCLKHLTGAEYAPELSRSLTLNSYNEIVRSYKKRNLQQAAKEIVRFMQENPGLYLGSNLDPDCYQNPFFEGEQWYDYNPQTVQQFRDWLSGTGLYSDSLSLNLQHDPYTLEELNGLLGTSFATWEEIQPPREQPCRPLLGKTDMFLQLWENFRRHIVHRHYSDLSCWLVEAGIPCGKIFSSQGFTAPRFTSDPFALHMNSPVKNYDSGGMSLAGSKPELGHIGAILYGESARNTIRTENGKTFFENIYSIDPDWAVVEFNPADLRDHPKHLPDYAFAWDCLRQIFNHGARYLNLMAWNGNTGKDLDKHYFNAHMALRDTPLEEAVIDFMLIHSDVPRGAICYSFGSMVYPSWEGWKTTDNQCVPTSEGLSVKLNADLMLIAPHEYLLAGKQCVRLRIKKIGFSLCVHVDVLVDGVIFSGTQRLVEMDDCYEICIDLQEPIKEHSQDIALQLATNRTQYIIIQRIIFD